MNAFKVVKACLISFRRYSKVRIVTTFLSLIFLGSTYWSMFKQMKIVRNIDDSYSRAAIGNVTKAESPLETIAVENKIKLIQNRTKWIENQINWILRNQRTGFNNTINHEKKIVVGKMSETNNIQESSGIKNKTKVAQLLEYPVINDFTIEFSVNLSFKCAKVMPETIIIIPTSRGNFQRRMNIRGGTQGRYTRSHSDPKANDTAIMVFFIGKMNPNETSQVTNKLKEELSVYNDMVVGDFEDFYHNILTKHVAMLKWVLRFCPGTKFVMRTDDDIHTNNISKMVQEMRRYKIEHENFILGRASGHDTLTRDPSNKKYYVSREDYAPDKTPSYVFGATIGYPLSTVKLLVDAAQRIRKVWLDDIYLTGICRERLGVPVFNSEAFHFKHRAHTRL